MADATARFALPMILPGQAQKELYHNEALAIVDAVLHPAVEGAPLQAPPASPLQGQAWLVAAEASGAWAGRDGSLAVWTEGGWRFVAPQPGMCVWDRSAGFGRRWSGAQWSAGELAGTSLRVGGVQVVGGRQPEVSSPSGGTIIDQEARTALEAVIATLKSHGLTD